MNPKNIFEYDERLYKIFLKSLSLVSLFSYLIKNKKKWNDKKKIKKLDYSMDFLFLNFGSIILIRTYHITQFCGKKDTRILNDIYQQKNFS